VHRPLKYTLGVKNGLLSHSKEWQLIA